MKRKLLVALIWALSFVPLCASAGEIEIEAHYIQPSLMNGMRLSYSIANNTGDYLCTRRDFVADIAPGDSHVDVTDALGNRLIENTSYILPSEFLHEVVVVEPGQKLFTSTIIGDFYTWRRSEKYYALIFRTFFNCNELVKDAEIQDNLPILKVATGQLSRDDLIIIYARQPLEFTVPAEITEHLCKMNATGDC